jgi:hypothetical protein
MKPTSSLNMAARSFPPAALGAIAFFSVTFSVHRVLSLKRQDFYYQGPRRWLRFHEKGGKEHEMPVHNQIEETLDECRSKVSIDAAPYKKC